MRWLLALLVLWFGLLVPLPVGAADITVVATPPPVEPEVTASSATNITSISAVLHGGIADTGGENSTMRGFEWGLTPGNYTWSWNETGSFGIGEFEYEIVGLNYYTQYFWRAFAENSVGRGNSTEQDFRTLCIPLAPTNFTLTQTGTNSINITWVMGAGATSTIIKSSSTGYPRSVTDGYLVYNGSGTSVSIDGLPLSFETYYYRAWSWNIYGYSLDYAEAHIGGSDMIVVAFIGLACFLLWMSYRRRELLVCLVTFLVWFALGVWLFFSDAGFFDLTQSYVRILSYVFFIISFVPLILSMTQEIRHEAGGKSWYTLGSPPKEEEVDKRAEYRKGLSRRLRR